MFTFHLSSLSSIFIVYPWDMYGHTFHVFLKHCKWSLIINVKKNVELQHCISYLNSNTIMYFLSFICNYKIYIIMCPTTNTTTNYKKLVKYNKE